MKDSVQNTKRIVTLALSVALAVILSYVEYLIPVSASVPGIKAGFANIAVLFVLYRFGYREAIAVSAVRVLLVALLFGSFSSLLYSVSGALCSFLVMALMRRADSNSPLGVSVCGAVAHNFGQIAAAVLLTGTGQIAYYLPVLMLTGTLAGIFVGIVASLLIRKIPQ